ncbi:MAG TPA: hypothetical protein VGP88_02585 [Thermoplasmata archaeon]|jgi:hypothetical protein|nr:hypothetical protein [Thermoplasmata archaeon]
MASAAIPPIAIDRWRSTRFGSAVPARADRPVRPARPRAPPRPAPLPFPDAPAIFPWLAPTLAPGEATVWAGDPRVVESMLELLYAGVAARGGRISLVEGSNRFLPYRIGEIGRALGADPGELLERIRLARAFTAYQMVAMVDGWAAEVRTQRPHLLVAHEVPELFHDAEELPVEERRPLLAHVARTLGTLAHRTGLPMLIVLADGLGRFPGLTDGGPRLFDLVRARSQGEGTVLEAFRDGRRLATVRRPPGQLGLEAFGATNDREVIAWDGPSRPIVRRSRSG